MAATPSYYNVTVVDCVQTCLWNFPADPPPPAQPTKTATLSPSDCPASITLPDICTGSSRNPASSTVLSPTTSGVAQTSVIKATSPTQKGASTSVETLTAISTPSTAPAEKSTVPGNGSSGGLAGGAVAGIAIGMLLAGALIAGFVSFFVLRRQKKRYAISVVAYTPKNDPQSERNVSPEKGATAVAAPIGKVDDLLPQPVEDDAITGDLSKIRDSIKNHVRTYYHSGSLPTTDINEAGIRDIAATTGTSTAVVLKALADPTNRDKALRSIIASVILTGCTGERSPSLLPNDVVAMSASIPVSNGNNSQSILYSRWKVVTGALLQQRYGKQSRDLGRAQTIQDTIASLDTILAPFVKGNVDGEKRRSNLDMVLTRAADFAFLLFTQPGTFRFNFASRQGSLTVFPALIQTVGDLGQSLDPVKALTEKEVLAL